MRRSVAWTDERGAGLAFVALGFSLDAFASHQLTDNLLLRVNAYNLTDNRNYVQVFGNRAVMGPGRAVTATVSVTF